MFKRAQEVRQRRIEAVNKEKLKKIDPKVYAVFIEILEILDKNTDVGDFESINVFVGELNNGFYQYSIREDGFYHIGDKIVDFKVKVDPFEYVVKLISLINSAITSIILLLNYQLYFSYNFFILKLYY